MAETLWLAAFSVQLEPPSVEYLTWKYAAVFAEEELVNVKVDVFEVPEQLPRDCDAPVSIIGQSTSSLVETAVYPPLKDPLLEEAL